MQRENDLQLGGKQYLHFQWLLSLAKWIPSVPPSQSFIVMEMLRITDLLK